MESTILKTIPINDETIDNETIDNETIDNETIDNDRHQYFT